jgi:hemerythrin
MKFLIEYTNIHFTDEEKLQTQFGYPDYNNHKKLHIEFKGMAINLSHTLEKEGVTDELINDTCVTMGR